jgi:hypothetical protein
MMNYTNFYISYSLFLIGYLHSHYACKLKLWISFTISYPIFSNNFAFPLRKSLYATIQKGLGDLIIIFRGKSNK